jgi:galactokinase
MMLTLINWMASHNLEERSGGHFQCCTAVALVQTGSVDGIIQKIAADYKKQTDIEATMFVSRPAAGATTLKV